MNKPPEDPMFFPRLRRHAQYTFIGMAIAIVAIFVVVAVIKVLS